MRKRFSRKSLRFEKDNLKRINEYMMNILTLRELIPAKEIQSRSPFSLYNKKNTSFFSI